MNRLFWAFFFLFGSPWAFSSDNLPFPQSDPLVCNYVLSSRLHDSDAKPHEVLGISEQDQSDLITSRLAFLAVAQYARNQGGEKGYKGYENALIAFGKILSEHKSPENEDDSTPEPPPVSQLIELIDQMNDDSSEEKATLKKILEGNKEDPLEGRFLRVYRMFRAIHSANQIHSRNYDHLNATYEIAKLFLQKAMSENDWAAALLRINVKLPPYFAVFESE